MFDTDVRCRRNHTPWARMNGIQFMKEMAVNVPEAGNHRDHRAVLSVVYRPDVASRFWWTVEWTSENGERMSADAQELDLCLWRAAEFEMKAQAKLRREKEKGNHEEARAQIQTPERSDHQ